MAWMFGGEAADRPSRDVKRLEISEGQFRTEGVAEIELPPLQGGAGLSHGNQTLCICLLSFGSFAATSSFFCTPSERRGNSDSPLRETLRTLKRSEY